MSDRVITVCGVSELGSIGTECFESVAGGAGGDPSNDTWCTFSPIKSKSITLAFRPSMVSKFWLLRELGYVIHTSSSYKETTK
jgi:hypothetical protein